MAVAQLTLKLANDADFRRTFTYMTSARPGVGTPIDMSGTSLIMGIRRDAADDAAALMLTSDAGGGTYDHSLIWIVNGGRSRLWRGLLTIEDGPSR